MEIETPMRMNHREAYAWQLGFGKGILAEKTDIAEWLEGINFDGVDMVDIIRIIKDKAKKLRGEIAN